MNPRSAKAVDVLAQVSGHSLAETYRVWAPRADSAALEVNGEPCHMHRDDRGWWAADRRMRPGDLYGFVLDGRGPFPDPRSRRQPSGVHGPSEVVDHARYAWTDDAVAGAAALRGVIYELHVGTFTEAGTFVGAIERLPHLVDLGVTHVELMPVAEFPGEPRLGLRRRATCSPRTTPTAGPTGSSAWSTRCHAAGLAVILDVVYNHLGPAGNYLGAVRPVLHGPPHDAVGRRRQPRRRGQRRGAPLLVRQRAHVAARLPLRRPAARRRARARRHARRAISWRSSAPEVETLEAMTGRHFVLIAESDLNDPRMVRSRDAGGFGLDAQWSDDFHHALHSVLTGERSGYYADFGTLDAPRPGVSRGLRLRRARTRRTAAAGTASPPATCPAGASSSSTQNHDQIGNRASGERLAHLTSAGRAADRRGAGADLAVRAAAVPGRGVGRVDAVPVLHRARGRGARRPGVGGAPHASSRHSAGTRRAFPIRSPRAPSRTPDCDGPSSAMPRMPSCWSGTARSSPSGASTRPCATAASATRR